MRVEKRRGEESQTQHRPPHSQPLKPQLLSPLEPTNSQPTQHFQKRYLRAAHPQPAAQRAASFRFGVPAQFLRVTLFPWRPYSPLNLSSKPRAPSSTADTNDLAALALSPLCVSPSMIRERAQLLPPRIIQNALCSLGLQPTKHCINALPNLQWCQPRRQHAQRTMFAPVKDQHYARSRLDRGKTELACG